MTQQHRLNQIEKSLSPKQAVVLWLQEIQDFRTPLEYVQHLRKLPEDEAPITKLTDQIELAIRRSMRGSPSETVNRAIRRAVKDVVFLVKLHLQANFHIMNNLRQWRLSQIALAECLSKMHVEMMLRNFIVDLADRVNFQTPYPLDPDIATAVDSALRHHVYTWEALEEEGIIRDWLWEYLMSQGAKELPLTASHYKDGKNQPNVTPENEAEIRACFQDEAQFQLFRSGQDYTCDLASVTDSEYNRHYDTIVSVNWEPVNSGKGRAVTIVELDVANMFLQEVPRWKGPWWTSALWIMTEQKRAMHIHSALR